MFDKFPADLDGFASKLFARAPTEDLSRYNPTDLDNLAESALAFLKERKTNTAKIGVSPPTERFGTGAISSISVVEILDDDMPYLFDSIMGELTSRGFDVRLAVHLPLNVRRDREGHLLTLDADVQALGAVQVENFIHIHVARIEDNAQATKLIAGIEKVIADVRVSVQDWPAMLSRMREVIANIRANPPPLDAGELAEAVQLLEWMAADNFILLGMRDYTFTNGEDAFRPKPEAGLGLLRSQDMDQLRRDSQLVAYAPETQEFLKKPRLLIVTKAADRSRVLRRARLDYVGVKQFDHHGKLIGECQICGLFASTAYTRSVRAIPYLRRKVDDIIRRSGLEPASQSGRALVNVLEVYPRDELFQIDEDTLYDFALLVLDLDQRPRVRVLSRRDPFGRFISVLVFVPRGRYDSKIQQRIGNYLTEACKGQVSAFQPFFSDGSLVRVHFIIERGKDDLLNLDRSKLEAAVAAIVDTSEVEAGQRADGPTPTPEIPTQGYGPHFEIDERGVITSAPTEALDRQGNNVARLKSLHPSLRALSTDLIGGLGTGNIPHWYLRERAEAYARLIDRDLERIDFALLYVEGVRLANAEKAATERIADKELPPLDARLREGLDTLLHVHGTFMLATAEGIELLAEEERYRRTPQEEIEYRAAAVDFAQTLQNRPDVIEPRTASLVLASAEEIGKGNNADRSGVVATGTVKNVAITVSTAATLAALSAGAIASASPALIVGAGAAVLVVGEGLKKSKSFAAVAALVTNGLDLASEAEVANVLLNLSHRLKPQLRFVLMAEAQLRRLAAQRKELAWLTRWLDWIKQQVSHEQ
jgi:hypothetical protein